MVYKFDGYNWLVRLEKGDKLMQSLTEFAEKEKIRGGWISGLGAALWVEIGRYDLASKEYIWQKLDNGLEIADLQGNISWADDKPALHIHGVFSAEDFKTYAGHVKELEISVTCEIFVHNWFSDKLTRSLDDSIGIKLLDL